METPDTPRAIDVLVHNAHTIVTMDPHKQIRSGASIAVHAGLIVDIGPASELETRYAPRRRVDASNLAAMPGIVNGHNHLFQVMCRGLGDGCSLTNWAQQAIYPLAPYFDAAAFGTAARLACIEMLESGTTTVVDSHYLHHDPDAEDAIARACIASGIRAIITRAAMDMGGVSESFLETPEHAVNATAQLIARWDGHSNRLSVRPEAMNEVTASRELILGLRALSREAGAGFHMHAAEERTRPERLERQVGFRTIDYLNHLGILGPDVVLAHCVWLSDREKKVLADSGTAVIHNPVSNQYLADGVAPIPELLELGVKVGLGTDGAASNNSLDMFEVFKSSALLHKAYLLRADVMSAAEVLELATIGGARALNIHSTTGSLEIGKRADIVLLDMTSPRMIPTYSIVSNLVFAASSRLVHTVLVEGQVVVAEGKCTLLDREEVLQEAQELERFFKTKLH